MCRCFKRNSRIIRTILIFSLLAGLTLGVLCRLLRCVYACSLFLGRIRILDPHTHRQFRRIHSLTQEWDRIRDSVRPVHIHSPYRTHRLYRRPRTCAPNRTAGSDPLTCRHSRHNAGSLACRHSRRRSGSLTGRHARYRNRTCTVILPASRYTRYRRYRSDTSDTLHRLPICAPGYRIYTPCTLQGSAWTNIPGISSRIRINCRNTSYHNIHLPITLTRIYNKNLFSNRAACLNCYSIRSRTCRQHSPRCCSLPQHSPYRSVPVHSS